MFTLWQGSGGSPSIYAHGAMPAGHGNRHEMGGLTDRSFALIGLTERGAKADWPWLDQPAA